MRIADPQVKREVLFWSLHSLGWCGYGLSQYVGAMVFDRPIGYTHVTIAATLFGILVTAPLRYFCRRLWGRSIFVMLPLAIALAYLAALAWRLGVNWAYLQWYSEWYIAHWPGLLVAALNFTYLLACWIGLYFGVRYYESMQVQRETALRGTSLAQEAQLTMLRYRLNPHFLFNTLNAISTLILDNRNKVANSTVTKLAEFLRYTLDQDPSKKVTVEQEVEALNLYLDIEKLRFDSRLRIVFSYPARSKQDIATELAPAAARRERDQVCGLAARAGRVDPHSGESRRRHAGVGSHRRRTGHHRHGTTDERARGRRTQHARTLASAVRRTQQRERRECASGAARCTCVPR